MGAQIQTNMRSTKIDKSRCTINSIPVEPHKLAILFIWFFCAVISDWIALAYIHDLVDWTPMHDPLFVLPQQKWASSLGDWMVSLSFVSLCLLLLLHRHRLLLLRRVLFLLALLNSLRSMMILLTRLPSSYADNQAKCRPRVEDPNRRNGWLLLERTVEQAVRLGLQDSSKKLLCGDQFFSGHTAMMTVSAMCLDYYMPSRFRLLSYLPKLFAIVGIPCMVLSRTHYSCDVLAGYFVSAIVFVLYHAICEAESANDRKELLILRTFLIAKLIHWFEREMPLGRLDNEFEVPFLNCLLHKLTNNSRRDKPQKLQQHDRESSTASSKSSSTVFFVNIP